MSVVQQSLTWGRRAFTALVIIVGLLAGWLWVQALVQGGSAVDAFVTTVLFVLLYAPLLTIEWADNRGA